MINFLESMSEDQHDEDLASARLDAMTQDRIRALEDEKTRLIAQINQLQSRIDQLGPQNARLNAALSKLNAALSNVVDNHVLSTILVALGGLTISYATFTGNAPPALAHAAAGWLLAGIFAMAYHSIYWIWRR